MNTLEDENVKIGNYVEKCYDDCEDDEKPLQASSLDKEKVNYRLSYWSAKDGIREIKEEEFQAEKDRRIKAQNVIREREIAERKKQEEIEKQRLAAEAEKKRLAEVERLRLAKLEEERAKKREEEKKEVQVVSRSQSYEGSGNWTTYEATYYSPYCTGCSGTTAAGMNARASIYHEGMRMIAVDPNRIPLYSIVKVQTPHETFTAIAADTGGAIKGSRVDILVGSKDVAYSLGRHNVKIQVIRSGR